MFEILDLETDVIDRAPLRWSLGVVNWAKAGVITFSAARQRRRARLHRVAE
jgi:hypothetical protein